mmetsp:Transcript_7424/g.11072  ORF Transcript_7424/g.11072 Transcript_7424/m.11072 type:complete len:421 (-) Transcript_7424:934-2196(-)
MLLKFISCFVFISLVSGDIINFERIGGIPKIKTYDVAFHNFELFNQTVNKLKPGDTFFIPNSTYTLIGGITASGLNNVTFQIDGTLSFSDDRATWPTNENGDVMECIYLENISNVIFTSSGKGTLDGNGKKWWGAIQFLKHQEDRPRLLHIKYSKNVVMEKLLLKNSPYWTFFAENSDGLVIRYTDVDARWTKQDYHTLIDLQAFNTDGFDVTGNDVYIHDCNIWNQDDCIAVKDGSQNMLFERISCSGLGLVIGSIGSSQVKNITFRDSVMPSTFKGIYLKTRWNDAAAIGDAASISDILYENITIDAPQQYAIWIGPAQQTGQPCSLLWPNVDYAQCIMSGYQTWENIVLRNITIRNPKGSPGVIFGNVSNPIRGLIFDNVVVENPGDEPWGDDFYYCEGIQGTALGNTFPVPPCFAE